MHLPEQGVDYQTSEHFLDSCGRHHPGNYKMKSITSKTQTGQFRLTATTDTFIAKSREAYKRYDLSLSTGGDEDESGGGGDTQQNGGHINNNKKHCLPNYLVLLIFFPLYSFSKNSVACPDGSMIRG